MNLEIIAQNVKRLRAIKGLSQKALAESSGISLPAIKKMEGAKNEPRVDTLRAISQALEIKLQDLFQPIRQLNTVRFRSNKKMRKREFILVQTAHWLDDFNFLEKILGNYIPSDKFREISRQCSGKEASEAAYICRKQLQLKDTEPVHNICGLLESAGIKILSIQYDSDNVFGLCIGEKDGGPAVVVNVWEKIPVERRIFSAAHEFAHLLLHQNSFDVEQTEENKQEEKEANHFAGHFLMPDEGFRSVWDDFAGLPMIERVFRVKRIFRVSYKAVLVRLIELKITDQTIWKRFNFVYEKQFGQKLSFKEEPQAISFPEPYGLKSIDFDESRFTRLVRKAIEADKISVGRGSEILKITTDEMQERITNWEEFF
jgi:Zn-dependent peptidase ImmA (M78 family)/transcriptional regulator with XRE-family HTH domain